VSFRFQFRRGTTAERNASNPVLAAGEPAVVLDSGQPAELVLGDGVTAMADLRAAVWDDDARLALAATATQPGDLGTAAAADVGDFAAAVQGTLVSQALTDGSDQTSTVTAELAALAAAGGGTYCLPTGTIRIDSQITLPHDSSTIWKMAPIKIIGGGHRHADIQQGLGAAFGGTVLDLRYAGSDAKILCLALGLLQFEQVTFTDGGTSTTPFILTTNTTLKMRDCTFIGNPTKAGVTCDQDAIILGGGQHAWAQGNLVTSSFAGYGSTFDNIRFSRIQRGFYGKSSCNSVTFNNNTWDATCGGLTAFELNGTGDQARGNTGIGNLIEVPYYQYGMTFTSADRNSFFGTSFWDATGVSVAEIRLVGSGSNGNEFHGTFGKALPTIENTSDCTYIRTGNAYQNRVVTAGLLVKSLFAAGAGFSEDWLINLARSTAEAVAPGVNVFYVNNKASAKLTAPTGFTPSMILASPSAGQIAYDHTSVVRDAGHLDLYGGSGTNDAVRIRRGVLVLKTYTTAGRPSASAAGPGATYYDTTVSKPVFSDGTTWRDAAGTAV
jgi:hypothetical protein